MLQSLYWTPFTAGVVDGLNPCFLMTSALVVLGMLWFKKAGINRWWIAFFIGMMVVDAFSFNCGFLDKFVLSNVFQILSRIVYLIMAIVIGLKGLKFLKHWFDMIKGKEIKQEISAKIEVSPLALMAVLFGIAFVLSMFATLWPINSYITTFSVYMLLPGQLIVYGSLVFLYTVITFWFVLMGMTVFSLEIKNQRLFKIIVAALMLSASLGVIEIIFTKG